MHGVLWIQHLSGGCLAWGFVVLVLVIFVWQLIRAGNDVVWW